MDFLLRSVYLTLSVFPLVQAQPVTILSGSATDKYFVGISFTYTDSNLPSAFPSIRYAPTVHYRIPLQAGTYFGWITFVEPNKTVAGQRLLTVSVQGQVSDPIDIFYLAPGRDVLFRQPFICIVTTNVCDINVAGLSGQNAVVSGIDLAGTAIGNQILNLTIPTTP